MNRRLARIIAAGLVAAVVGFLPARPELTAQNQPGDRTPPGSKEKEPAPAPGTPLYISPGIVALVQRTLVERGYPMPTTSGAWGENSAAGLAQYQKDQGLDAGGDLDELTLLALGMPEVLRGEAPPGAVLSADDGPVPDGAPLSASPRLTRLVQNALMKEGFPPHNVFGIWIPEIDGAPRNYQKARGLDPTNTLDLALIHSLGLTHTLVNPIPGKLPTDSVAQILSEENTLLTGTPITISSAGIRQIQRALDDRGVDVEVDGKWSDALSASLRKFQDSQKLEPTGTINLRTLKALGFANPLADLDRPPSE